jgi:hypothetical protein
MSFKEQNWVDYGRKAKFVEVNVKDSDNQTIDFFKLRKDRTRDVQRMIKKIKEKHGFDLNSLEEETENKFLKKDLKWN